MDANLESNAEVYFSCTVLEITGPLKYNTSPPCPTHFHSLTVKAKHRSTVQSVQVYYELILCDHVFFFVVSNSVS